MYSAARPYPMTDSDGKRERNVFINEFRGVLRLSADNFLTGATKQYPLPDTVTIYLWSPARSPKAFLSAEICWGRLFYSTDISGQTVSINFDLDNVTPGSVKRTANVSKALAVSWIGVLSRESWRFPRSRRDGPNSYAKNSSWSIISPFRKVKTL